MIDFIKEFGAFLIQQKKFWMIPLIIILLIISFLFVLSQSTVLAPFIYTIF